MRCPEGTISGYTPRAGEEAFGYTLHTVHCTLQTTYCTLHTIHCTLHIAHCTPLSSVQSSHLLTAVTLAVYSERMHCTDHKLPGCQKILFFARILPLFKILDGYPGKLQAPVSGFSLFPMICFALWNPKNMFLLN